MPAKIGQWALSRKLIISDAEKDKINDLFFGLYASDPAKFEFEIGEIVLIGQVVKFVKENKDISYFGPTEDDVKNSQLVIKVAIGYLFAPPDIPGAESVGLPCVDTLGVNEAFSMISFQDVDELSG